VFSLVGTYCPSDNRLIVTWNRAKADGRIKHEVRYAFSDVHEIGWAAAIPAPDGIITPPHDGDYNNMVYDTKKLRVSERTLIYIAIKPQNARTFSQIAIPLKRPPSQS